MYSCFHKLMRIILLDAILLLFLCMVGLVQALMYSGFDSNPSYWSSWSQYALVSAGGVLGK